MRPLVPALALVAAFLAAAPATAQETAPAAADQPQSAILTLDQDRLFTGSLWGKRTSAEIETASQALQAENRKIEADLTTEERSLTDRRATMTPEAFRAEADAFDTKVTGIRAAQEAKSRDIAARRDSERQAFLNASLPVIGEVLAERGAVVVIDRRSVFVSANSIDVTDVLIARIDGRLGDGTGVTPPAAPADDTSGNAP